MGDYDFAQTVMFALAPVVFLEIKEAILKYTISENDKFEREKIISTSAVFTIGIALTMGLLAEVLHISKLNYGFNWSIAICITVFYSVAQIWQFYARALSFIKEYVSASIISTLVNFVCVILFVCVLRWGFMGLIASYIAGQLSVFVFLESKIKIVPVVFKRSFDKNIMLELIKYSSPLIFNSIAAWAITGVGKSIVRINYGSEANGLFSFAQKFSMLVTLLGGVISMALVEEVILKINDRDIGEYFSNVISKLLRLFISACSLAMPCIAIFYNFLGGTNYQSSLSLVPILLFYAVVTNMSINLASVFQAVGKTSVLFSTTLVGAVITLILSMLLVKPLGLAGVALSQSVGGLSMFILRWRRVRQVVDFKVRYLPLIILGILYTIISYLSVNLYWIYSFVIFIIVAIACLFINKKEAGLLVLKLRSFVGKKNQ
ncbi:MAG: Polysaccharide biosynthesis protein [Firmicutes bacterium ADurb.Bin419]|nr:MAG: Polysaccharide biosynthesis protein [Firmicutes bacterium ADurb.Bin419]